MFGYIRPLKGELKVKEYDRFKAAYCGLCHSMKRNCGFAARFMINYDLTFMAMLLSEQESPCLAYKRCVVSPFRKKCHCTSDPAFDIAASYSVILTCWKLRDSVRDEPFFKSLLARAALLFIWRSYKRAARREPDFDLLVKKLLSELSALEAENCPSLDETADKFARILEGAASVVAAEPRRRAVSQVFYHAGRIVYIVDAADDLKDDLEKGLYNPLISRFNTSNGTLSPEDKDELLLTLQHSENLMISAFELLDRGPWSEILENIIYMGIPQAASAVLAGRWRKPRRNET